MEQLREQCMDCGGFVDVIRGEAVAMIPYPLKKRRINQLSYIFLKPILKKFSNQLLDYGS